MIFVLNKDSRPLMPSYRYHHIKTLIKKGLAEKVKSKPYTVRLLYETEDITQPLILGVDPGRTNIGLSVINTNGQSIANFQCETRNKEVPKLMAKRKAYRLAHRRNKRRLKRQRRAVKANPSLKKRLIERYLPHYKKPVTCKFIKNKPAKFANRKRPEGWLTPTANHLLITHLNLIKKIAGLLPISEIVIELNKFAFMAMDNPKIKKWEYQRGPLYKEEDLHRAVEKMQKYHCLFCEHEIEHYHHIVPKHKGGSDTIDNIAGLCFKHHTAIHTDEAAHQKLLNKKSGLNKKYGALSVLNQVIPFLLDRLSKQYNVSATDGRNTKLFRDEHDLVKDHYIDAYCIACSIIENPVIDINNEVIYIKQFRRHDRQACIREMVSRKYYLDGKLVATNRHKAFEQVVPSLEDYVNTGGRTDNLTVKEHKPVLKDTGRIMPGAILQFKEGIDVLRGTIAKYYTSVNDYKIYYKKGSLLYGNTGLVFI